MKKFFAMAILFASFSAQAETYCSISRENPKQKGVYDQVIMQGEKVLQGKQSAAYIVVGNKATPITENAGLEQFLKWNNADLVGFTKSGNSVVISSSHLDTSDLSDMTRLDAIAFGGGDLMALTSSARKLSIVCIER